MSKHEGGISRSLRISGTGTVAKVELDGHDISNELTGLTLRLAAGDVPMATLDVLAIDRSAELDSVHVVMSSRTEELLLRLGWTPPKHSTEQRGGEG